MKKLWIIDDTKKIGMPKNLSSNQQIIPNSIIGMALTNIYIVTYEENSERAFGGSFIKAHTDLSKFNHMMWVSSTLTKGELLELIDRYFDIHFENIEFI